MIRVAFNTTRFVSWSHEMLAHRSILETLRANGVPILGRLVYTGIERGELICTTFGAHMTFDFFEQYEPRTSGSMQKVRDGDACQVFLSGEHLSAHLKAAEDLF